MGDFLKWVIAGTIGGVIGAAIWAGITYGTNHEIGWIAWGIGVLVGFAVRVAAGNSDGFGPGLVAAVIAVLSIVGGKYAASALMVNAAMKEVATTTAITADDMIQSEAAEIVEEWTTANKKLKWAPGKSLDEAESLADYPADVVAEAKKRWTAKPAAQQQEEIATRTELIRSLTDMIAGQARHAGFMASFSPIDGLFFLLAVMSAFKLGSGVTSDD
jgi:hypothetical protein